MFSKFWIRGRRLTLWISVGSVCIFYLYRVQREFVCRPYRVRSFSKKGSVGQCETEISHLVSVLLQLL